MRKMLLLAACILCSALFQGCTVLCQHPLSDPNAKQVDERLLGTWRWMAEDRTYFLHIAQAAKDEGAQFAHIEVNPGSGVDVTEGNFFTTKIGEHSYANIQIRNPNEDQRKENRYLLVFYEFDKRGWLKWSLANTDEFAKAVDGKLLPGKVTSRDRTTQVELSASTEDLVTFLKGKSPYRLFTSIEGGGEMLERPKGAEELKEEDRKK